MYTASLLTAAESHELCEFCRLYKNMLQTDYTGPSNLTSVIPTWTISMCFNLYPDSDDTLQVWQVFAHQTQIETEARSRSEKITFFVRKKYFHSTREQRQQCFMLRTFKVALHTHILKLPVIFYHLYAIHISTQVTTFKMALTVFGFY